MLENSPIEEMVPINRVLPYYGIALNVAKDSPCVRRKYGAVIAQDLYLTSACNSRVSNVCDLHCIRDRYGVVAGSRTELGAEVHAEQAVLIDTPEIGRIFVLAGWQVEKDSSLTELEGTSVFPCLVCARMIKYAGYKWVYVKNGGQVTPVSIHEIIKYREMEIGPHYE